MGVPILNVNSTTGRPALVAATLTAVLAWATAVFRSERILGDPDVLSHIAVGNWILAHGQIPAQDAFSHSMMGAPWVAHEWLAEAGLALVYGKLGWPGLVAATAICFAIALALLAAALLRYLPPLAVAVAVVGAWGLCLPHLSARPHILVLPLLVAWTASLVAARAADRAPSPWLALLMVAWANLHGSHVFGLALAGLFAAEALFDADDMKSLLRALRHWALFLALALVAALVTPHGVSSLMLPFELEGMSYALSWVNEFQPPDMRRGHVLEIWLMLALFGALSLGVRLPMTRTLMALLLLHMALIHQRHAELLGLCVPLILAPALGPQLAAAMPSLGPTWSRLLARTLLGAAAIAATAAAVYQLPRVVMPTAASPVAAVDAVRRQGIKGPVLNSYDYGGYLMFVGIAPFIDGRMDLYGDAFLRRYNDLAGLPRLLADYKIAWTLFRKDDPQVAELDRLPGWRRLYADDTTVVHVPAH